MNVQHDPKTGRFVKSAQAPASLNAPAARARKSPTSRPCSECERAEKIAEYLQDANLRLWARHEQQRSELMSLRAENISVIKRHEKLQDDHQVVCWWLGMLLLLGAIVGLILLVGPGMGSGFPVMAH